MTKIQIINGPNLNLLGKREPGIYGNQGFQSYLEQLRSRYPGIQIDYYQSNHEGGLIDKIHEVGFSYDGLVLQGGEETDGTLTAEPVDGLAIDEVKRLVLGNADIHRVRCL